MLAIKKDRISQRQLCILLFLGLLSPGIRLLSGRAVSRAGALGWLAPLGALVPLLLLEWMTVRLSEEKGLAEGLRAAFGRIGGSAAILLYIVWGFILLTVELRLYARRMTGVSPGGTGRWFVLAVLCGVLAWLAAGKVSAFARAGELFRLAMAVLLAVVIGLGLFHIQPLNLFPVENARWTALPAASAEAAALLSTGVYGGFLVPYVLRPGGRRQRIGCTAALCGVLALIHLVILGGMGASMAGRSELPLFVLTRDMSIGGAVQRLEGLTLSLWVLSDLTLLGVLLFALKTLLPGEDEKWLPAVLLAAALLLGELLFPEERGLEFFSGVILPAGNLIVCFGLPLLGVLCKSLWERGEGRDISCGEKSQKSEDIVSAKKSEKKKKKA